MAPLESVIEKDTNEPRRQTPVSDGEVALPAEELPPSLTIHRALTRLLRKRVKRFVALAPEVRANANPKTVHDARVWSRRLQQAVSAFFPKPRSGKVRRLRRMPRKIRRALGEWRNYDVLLEIVARRQRRARSEAKQRAWAFVRDYLLAKRSKAIARTGKKLLRQDLRDYASLANKLLGQPPEESPEILLQRLRTSVQGAWTHWQAALSRAQETRAVNDLHAFRIATKDLRYRTELLFDLGQSDRKAQLKWLAGLQEALGIWHDRQMLDQAVAEAIARAEILLNELQTARILLAEVEMDRRRESEDVEKIFRLAVEHSGHQPIESRSPSRLTPHMRVQG